MTRQVINAARAYIGTPFRHQGRVKGLGVDCVGLVAGVATDLGLTVLDRTGYGRQPYRGELEAALDEQPMLARVFGEPEPGDVLVMGFAGPPQHVGILTDNGTMIHAWESAGKVTEHTFSGSWRSRVRRVYRIQVE